MRIKIAVKLRPFSHKPGTRCLIPYSSWEISVFPAKLFFYNLAKHEELEISLPIKGPVGGFTILQDMEKGRVEVFGRGKRGYFRYFITTDGIKFAKGEKIPLPFLAKIELPTSQKRLSLGVHKKQDWDLIQRRSDMAEVFPFWIRLSQLIPQAPLAKVGTAVLVEEGRFDLAFQTAFQGILCPRLCDENHLGILPEIETEKGASPLGLIHYGAEQIEALFFYEEGNTIHLLPNLPKELHAGRFVHLTTSKGDDIDIEWSKKELKKVILRPGKDRSIQLALQSRLRAFRLRTGLRQKGEECRHCQSLTLEKGKTLYLDRFTH